MLVAIFQYRPDAVFKRSISYSHERSAKKTNKKKLTTSERSLFSQMGYKVDYINLNLTSKNGCMIRQGVHVFVFMLFQLFIGAFLFTLENYLQVIWSILAQHFLLLLMPNSVPKIAQPTQKNFALSSKAKKYFKTKPKLSN